eukprot:1150776-Pelagomonas_calceolata.AAC.9
MDDILESETCRHADSCAACSEQDGAKQVRWVEVPDCKPVMAEITEASKLIPSRRCQLEVRADGCKINQPWHAHQPKCAAGRKEHQSTIDHPEYQHQNKTLGWASCQLRSSLAFLLASMC